MSDDRVPESACLACGKKLDAATVVTEPEKRPKQGDVTVCMYCGHIMAFAADLTLRELTGEEIHDVAGNADILAIQRARARVFKL